MQKTMFRILFYFESYFQMSKLPLTHGYYVHRKNLIPTYYEIFVYIFTSI